MILIFFRFFFGVYIKTHTFALKLKTKTTMKKVLSIVAIASLAVATVACGPSKADLEKKAKEQADSARAAFVQDSTTQAATTAAAQVTADSLKAVETAKAAEAAAVAHEDSVKKKLIKPAKK
jgi:hypothetical protein